MLIHYPLLATYLIAVILLIATPGPVVMLVVGTAARYGFRQGLLTAMGTNAASLVLIGLASLMVFGVVMVSERLLAWLHVLGCLFVAMLAIQTLYSEWRTADQHNRIDGNTPALKPQRLPGVVNGFLVGIANPKDLLFFVAFFPQFVAITSAPRASLTILAALWIAIDLTILTLYVAAINHPRIHRQRRWIHTVSAALLFVISIAGLVKALGA